MQKERAASAIKHGLPVPPPQSTRNRSGETPSAGSLSSAPPLSGLAAPNQRMPLPVKLLGLGLALLGLVYGLTLFRDHKPSAEPERARPTLESEAAILAPVAAAPALPTSPSASAGRLSVSALPSAPALPKTTASLKVPSLSAQPAATGAVK